MSTATSRRILIPIPATDFDPTEVAVPWLFLSQNGFEVSFATPTGEAGSGDPRMRFGTGLGPLKPLLAANREARRAYQAMSESLEFRQPLRWDATDPRNYDGLILPGGHAPGMKTYLESKHLQATVSAFFADNKPVGAICHGVVLAARSRGPDGRSVLHGRKTTALLASQELTAWGLTRLWLGDYYRTYPQTVESEVRARLSSSKDFLRGPLPLLRDRIARLSRGFCVVDGLYVSARWPGDAHRFASEFAKLFA